MSRQEYERDMASARAAIDAARAGGNERLARMIELHHHEMCAVARSRAATSRARPDIAHRYSVEFDCTESEFQRVICTINSMKVSHLDWRLYPATKEGGHAQDQIDKA